MKNLLSDWRLPWLLLLLPVVIFLPALPIDETRYLAVAWEMHLHGNFLVPHLNGTPYSDKPPLLFWMINLGWLIAGLHVWVVRLGTLIASCVWLPAFVTVNVVIAFKFPGCVFTSTVSPLTTVRIKTASTLNVVAVPAPVVLPVGELPIVVWLTVPTL